MNTLAQRIEACDWKDIEAQLDQRGYALTPELLTSTECDELIRLYADPRQFRNRVVMERYRFGRGEYQYFADPLPQLVLEMRSSFYSPLAAVANRWAERLKQSERFPESLEEFLEVCRRARQTSPTPLMLRYETGDYNCLHQDLYGEVAFPFQSACVLNRTGLDYTGGEFLLTEQRPRVQTRCEAVTIERGRFIVFPNRWRPVKGTRSDYRVNMRHGVSSLKSGKRYCLGLIFHNAK
ncbi:MAG TPA: 2OG-Fe(II) oxygenase [Blastocatellia bacterium]|nr:2OG-Fe(II) oxygenase [Blastocatellia bacterium]